MLTAHLDGTGGTERQCIRLSRELAALGHTPLIVTRRPPSMPRRGLVEGIAVERVGGLVPELVARLRRKASPPTAQPKASSGDAPRSARIRRFASLITHKLPTMLIEREVVRVLHHHRARVDVLHLHGVYWTALARSAARASRDLDKPLVVKITNEPERTWAILEADREALAALTGADAIITVSEAARAFFLAKALGPRVVLIPNGVAVPATPVADGGDDVVYVGTLKEQKGVDVLLRAWAAMGARRERLLLLGDGPERAKLEELAGALGVGGSVRFEGMRDDVDAYLRRARAFVLPSRWEGMPNALLEAMSYGLPCVATDVDGSRDLVEDARSGLLARPDDPEALAAALARILDDRALAAALGTAARARVEQSFSLPAVAARTLALYDEVTRARRVGKRP